jgi:hypothetical protein
MELNILFNRIKRYRYLIAISLVLAFAIGAAAGLIFNKTVYRSIARVDTHRISLNISKTFDENYYYLFFRYFLNSEKYISDIKTDLFKKESVLQKSHEKLTGMNFDISYDDYVKGIEVDMRDSRTVYRVATVFPDSNLSVKALEVLLDETKAAFDYQVKERVIAEIEHREFSNGLLAGESEVLAGEIGIIMNQIQDASAENEKEAFQVTLSDKEKELKRTNRQIDENNIHIERLNQIAGFSFWELFERDTEIIEEGNRIEKNAVGIGLAAVVFALLSWLIVFYADYILKQTGGKNG